ncbi:unnamed protein product [Caretta caretta]
MTGPVPHTISGSQYVQRGKNGIGAQLVDLLLILLQTAVPPGHSTGGRMNSFRIKTNCIVPGTRLYDTAMHCCSHTEDMAPKAVTNPWEDLTSSHDCLCCLRAFGPYPDSEGNNKRFCWWTIFQ